MAAAPARLFQLIAGNATLIVAVLTGGALLFALFPAAWEAVAHRRRQRQWKRRHPATVPSRVIDDALPLFFERRTASDEEFERLASDDEFRGHGLHEAIEQILREASRG